LENGDPERAARLFGAADALLEPSQGRLDAPLRGAYDVDMPAALSLMGHEAFTAAYSEGRTMTLEQCIALAR
jgi:hypothetical protein